MLVTCPECGKQISREADPCPQCGFKNAGERSKEWAEEEVRRQRMVEDLRARNNDPASALVRCENKHCNFRGEVKGSFKVETIQYQTAYQAKRTCRCPKCGSRAVDAY
jgi:hypothetical protein